jgi:hypothetical protein
MGYPAYWPEDGWKTPHKWNTAASNESKNERLPEYLVNLVAKADLDGGTKADLLEQFDWEQHKAEVSLCSLQPSNPFFQAIAAYVGGSVSENPVKTSYTHESAFPMSWIKDRPAEKLPEKRNRLKEFFGKDRLKATSVLVTKVKIVKIASLWARYEACRNDFRQEFDTAGKGGEALFNVHWAHKQIPIDGQGLAFPIIDRSIGECWLFQGQTKDTLKLIVQNGFNPKFCNYSKSTGYGAMGKGMYFTDQFEKAAQYSPCPECRATKRCKCDRNRTLVISRVLLGNPYVLTKKNKGELRRGHNLELAQTVHQDFNDIKSDTPGKPDAPGKANDALKGFTSVFGQGKFNHVLAHKAPDGGADTDLVRKVGTNAGVFSSNEFLLREAATVYPEFIVYFRYPE